MSNIKDNEIFVNIFTDFGFKLAFGNLENDLFIKMVLQQLIDSEFAIQEITFTNVEQYPNNKEGRISFVDISCRDELDRHFVVEMQQQRGEYFFNRLKFYASKKFDEIVKKGDFRFWEAEQIYAIVFVRGKAFPKYKDFVHTAKIYNQNMELIDEQITYIVVELGKFKKTEEQLETELDKIIFFMKKVSYLKSKDNLPEYFSEEPYAATMSKLEIANLTPAQLTAYEMNLSAIKENEYNLAREKREGIKEGKREGRKEGKLEGRREGKLEMVIELLSETKMKVEKIAKISGLTVEEVQKIKDEIK